MHFAIVTHGSRGDVQPMVAVGQGLAAAGHRVTVVTHEDFEPMVTSRDLGFRPLTPSSRPIFESEKGRRWTETTNIFEWSRLVDELYTPLGTQWACQSDAAIEDADALLFYSMSFFCTHAAEKRGLPMVCLAPWPTVATGAYLSPGFPDPPVFRAALRRLQWELAFYLGSRILMPLQNAHREALGLAPLTRRSLVQHMLDLEVPIMHLVSPSVMPRPDDWPARVTVDGYAFLEAEDTYEPQATLKQFIEAADPPLAMGFGSMVTSRPRDLVTAVEQALERCDQRAVFLGGWSSAELAFTSDRIHFAEDVPHDWLFPRVSAVVHHGGAGTTAAGLRAGRPSIICPFFADQPLWGQRVLELGVGPRPIRHRHLTADKLAAAIDETLASTSMRERARQMGEAIRAEHGVTQIVRSIERYLGV